MRRDISNTEEHMRQGIERLKAPIAGRMAVTGLMFVLIALGASKIGVTKPGYFALAGVVCVELGLLWYRIQRRKSNQAKAERQYEQLDKLKQQEFALRYFALRYEEAKLDGKLDRWTKPK